MKGCEINGWPAVCGMAVKEGAQPIWVRQCGEEREDESVCEEER